LSNTTGWSNSFAGLPTVMLNGPPLFGTTTDGWNYVSDQIENTLITGYAGSNNVVMVPSLINALPVTGIAPHAFFYDFDILTSVTIPDGVTSIGDSAFYQCRNLTNVSMGNSITYIGNSAFCQCYSLTNVTIGNSVTNIGYYAFDECSVKSVTIPNSVTSIGGGAFVGCVNLISLTIGNGVTSIGDSAFEGCSDLTNVTIPDSVISIGASAFEFCYDLTSVTLPNCITSIGDDAFQDTALTSITIPKNVTTIGIGAFGSLNLLTKVFFAGSAPANANQYAFSYDYGDGVDWSLDPAKAYYLPGTAGWAAFSANTGIPTVLWLPQAQTGDASFGVRSNQFGFNIAWASGQTVVVEACTNLFNPVWLPVSTNTLINGSSYFSDPQPANLPGRFYRLRSP
jgi:BspA type Leucine rich repeat region (6 copies)